MYSVAFVENIRYNSSMVWLRAKSVVLSYVIFIKFLRIFGKDIISCQKKIRIQIQMKFRTA